MLVPEHFRATADGRLLAIILLMIIPSTMLKELSEMTNPTVPSYLEMIEFIAAGTTPQSVAEYRPSQGAQQRIEELIECEKNGHLSPAEKSELDHFMELEHIMRMAKARARQILRSGS
jgi:hypothetical protein